MTDSPNKRKIVKLITIPNWNPMGKVLASTFESPKEYSPQTNKKVKLSLTKDGDKNIILTTTVSETPEEHSPIKVSDQINERVKITPTKDGEKDGIPGTSIKSTG